MHLRVRRSGRERLRLEQKLCRLEQTPRQLDQKPCPMEQESQRSEQKALHLFPVKQ